jgi:superfamily I DNA/RNA helicase
MHSFKGLEMEAVILPYLHKTFARPEDEARQRRLIYMAMTRARSQLYMTYCGRLPKPYDLLARESLVDVID